MVEATGTCLPGCFGSSSSPSSAGFSTVHSLPNPVSSVVRAQDVTTSGVVEVVAAVPVRVSLAAVATDGTTPLLRIPATSLQAVEVVGNLDSGVAWLAGLRRVTWLGTVDGTTRTTIGAMEALVTAEILGVAAAPGAEQVVLALRHPAALDPVQVLPGMKAQVSAAQAGDELPESHLHSD